MKEGARIGDRAATTEKHCQNGELQFANQLSCFRFMWRPILKSNLSFRLLEAD
jgi:hypothetical protein